ncbi:MAG TPA: pteridine-dependent deoxygenase like protein [Wenzhouxiangellaceae bacterium]|nr:pteridine-dependent deoxygenase like protein [Wenzhouxiangellaceae bacterium]
MTTPQATAPTYRLEVDTVASGKPILEIALDGRGHPEGPGLEFLGGDYDHECWGAPEDQLCAIVMSEPDDPGADAALAAETLYRKLIRTLGESRFGYPLRLWNYFPAINHGDDDRERYRRFCVGRGRALEAAGLNDARMCAATAIGGEQPVMQLVALAGVSPGISIENPRQVSAWNYPRRYGPRQPAFARATGIDLENGRAGLLVSGTASVIGHATAHSGDALAQADEAASNLDALLGHAAGVMNRPDLARFNSDSLARVYVRHAEDWSAIEQRLRRRWPALKLCALRGDVCRGDLLVEIEAWHTA